MAELRVGSGRAWLLVATTVAIMGASSAFAQAPSPEVIPPGELLPGGPAPGTLPAGPIPGQEMVVDVRVEGNRAVSREKVLSLIHTRVGRPFDADLIEKDVRTLNRSRLFALVKPSYQLAPGGRIVVFQVVERPILHEILYVGNTTFRKKVLEGKSNLKPGDAMDPGAIEEGRKKIEDFYRQRGFSKVRVTLLEGDKLGDSRAVYLINEGFKQKVLWTYFIGNTIASDSRLRTQIKSVPGFLYLFKGEVDRKEIDEDVKRLTAYYHGLGFLRAKIGREFEFNEKQNWLVLTFIIDEGPRYSIRSASFVGNTKIPTEKLESDLKLKPKQFFNKAKMDADIAGVQEKYGSIGYVFADIKTDVRMVADVPEVELVYAMEEGDRYRVGRINVDIRGDNTHTRLTAVLNQIPIRPGEIVDIRKIREGERKLRASGLFMVDPSRGEVPRIVFSPPDKDDSESAVAGRPKHRVNYRGQSPDPPSPDQWHSTPPAPLQRGSAERTLDLWIDGTLPEADAPPGGCPNFRVNENGTVPFDASSTPQPQPQAWPSRAKGQEPPLVIRGQYTSDAMPASPPSRPRQLWASEPRPASTATYQPQDSGQLPGGPQLPPAGGAPVATQGPAPGAAGPPAQLGPNGGTVGPPQLQANVPFDEDAPGGVEPEDRVFTRPLDLGVRVQEAQTGRLMLGVGVNSEAGVVGSLTIEEQNFDITRLPTSWEDIRNATAFRGAGQRFRIEAIPGTQVQRYLVSFQEPYLLNTEVSLGLSGFFFDRIYNEWKEQRLGGRVSLGYHLTHRLTGSLSFRAEKINVRDPILPPGIVPALDQAVGDNYAYGVGAQLAHDTRDSPFLATEGHLFEIGFEQVLGSFQYPRGDVDVRQYFKLYERPDGSGRHVLSVQSRLNISGDTTPIYDRYYAGGFSTLRGFEFRGVSPQQAGVNVGGDFMLLASAEYMFPITADDMLRAVVFCDTGTVEPTFRDWQDKYRVAPGFGLRITIPAMGPAPLAFDFAFPIAFEETDRRQVFAFFLGVLR